MWEEYPIFVRSSIRVYYIGQIIYDAPESKPLSLTIKRCRIGIDNFRLSFEGIVYLSIGYLQRRWVMLHIIWNPYGIPISNC